MTAFKGLSIAHVYNYLSPRAGGPPQVIAHLSAALTARGHRCVLLSHDANTSEVESFLMGVWGGSLPERFTLHNRSFFRPPSASLQALLKGVDVVHLHSIWPPQCELVSRACRSSQIPYLLSLHGHLRAEALKIRALKKALGFRVGYRRMLEQASAYHALNESEREDTRRFGLTGHVAVIPNGVSSEAVRRVGREQLPAGLRESLGLDPYLLFLSRVHPPKGAQDLAQAFVQLASRHPRLQLVVAGADEAGGVAQVAQVAERAGLSSRVHLPGFVEGAAKAALLQNARLFCLPSYHEGFSVAILEAMACQTPVVISEGCHFSTVERESLGWVHPCGSEPLLEVLSEALSCTAERARRAERAARWVEEHATWPQLASTYERLYLELLS